LDAIETEDVLIQRCKGKKTPSVACIGQAGENLSFIAGIVNDRGRLAARSGLGAVMGSKKLKAVVLAGARPIHAANPVRMYRLSMSCVRKAILPISFPNSRVVIALGKLVSWLPFGFTFDGLLLEGILARWGTPGLMPYEVETGDTPFKNWAGTSKDLKGVHRITNPEKIVATETRKYHCYSCPLGCGGIVSLGEKLPQSHKPEYETIAAFSTLVLNGDIELVYQINEYLNRAGMDTISAGNTVAFAMECYEKGWITKEDTGGLALSWGNGQAIWEVVHQMVKREGFGATLSDGSKRAAKKLRPEAMEASIQAGGQEIGFHDPRLDPGMGLHASVEPTPGRHTTGAQLYYEMYHLWTRVPGLPKPTLFYDLNSRTQASAERISAAVANSEFTQVYNGAGGCMFGMLIGVDRVPVFEWLNAATGWNYTPAEYMEIGRRVQTLRQSFNIREGIHPMDLKVSKRLFVKPPLQEGPNQGKHFDLETMMHAYWKAIGWDEASGAPTHETLAALELTDLVRE
jgi:aldehyde:ferredoxin oxidoreductase